MSAYNDRLSLIEVGLTVEDFSTLLAGQKGDAPDRRHAQWNPPAVRHVVSKVKSGSPARARLFPGGLKSLIPIHAMSVARGVN